MTTSAAARGDHEHPRTDEPAEIGEGEEECALAAVEVPPGACEKAGGADHMRGRLGAVLVGGERGRAEQDCHVVVQPVGPGEFEEGIDEDHGKADDLGLPLGPRGFDAERQARHHGEDLVGGPQERERTADGDERGGGKEGGAVLQRRHDLHVDHTHVALEHAADPHFAVAIHQ
jgi:hypothetical protein